MTDFTTVMTAVERAVGVDPAGVAVLLAAADWCDGNEKTDLAYALRWCAGRGKRPHRRDSVIRYRWLWVRGQKRYRNLSQPKLKTLEPAVLPSPLYDALDPDGAGRGWMMSFKTCQAAYTYLAGGLRRLRDAVEIGHPPAVTVRPPEVRLDACRECGVALGNGAECCPVCKSQDVVGQ